MSAKPVLRRLAIGTGVVLLLLVLAAAGLAALLTSDRARGYFNESGSGRLGRNFAIEGNLDIDWHWRTPRIRAGGIRLANMEGGSEPDMLRIEALDFRIKLWPLLLGRIELPQISATRPCLLLEKLDENTVNWDLPAFSESKAVKEAVVPEERGDFPLIGLLEIREGSITYRDVPRKLNLNLDLDTATGAGGAERAFTVSGVGTLQGQNFELQARGGSLAMLRESEKPYPLTVDLSMGATRVRANGTFTDPLKMRSLDTELQVEGPNLADLFYLTGVPLPLSPPYRLAGRVTKHGQIWASSGFEGIVGDSDLSGSFSYNIEPTPNLFLRAELISNSLDLDDLGGLIGLTPGTGEGETATPEQQALSQQRQASPRLLPDVPINLERIRAANMDVVYRAGQIRAPGWPFKGMELRIRLQDGVLRFDPLHFDLADGAGEGALVLDGRTSLPNVRARLDLSRLSIDRFFEGTRFEDQSEGNFGGHIELAGQGLSLAEVLGHSDGQVIATMAGGRVSLLLVEAADIDIAEAAPLLLGDDRSTIVRCGVADFMVRDGILSSNLFILDTDDFNIRADVAIDLRTESINARADVAPKDPSLLSLQSPITISGRLKSPDIGLDPVESGARAGAAALLGTVLTPLAAVIPFIEFGLGEDSPCGELIARARAAAAEPAAGNP